MESRATKDRLFDGFAAIGKALASGRRLELLDVLAQGPRSVDHLAAEIGQSVANTSAHLRVLAGAGLVDARRDGNRVVYALAGPAVEDLWAAVRATAGTHAAAIDRLARDYLGDRDELELVTRAELARWLRRGDQPVVIDVRPAAEFVAGHIPGARSVPPDRVDTALRRLPRDVDVVAYCRGAFCVLADDAVRALRRRRVRARRLEDGFPEWRSEGRPVAVGTDRADEDDGARERSPDRDVS
ncbi:MAG TPA: metalloregulator ArsR/SmtB family transcription factor [Acidimicrobiales bacterium]|nr:metalloregulator ArsR/SmtB family transcription factor [Acidimicrobiales bacterium]